MNRTITLILLGLSLISSVSTCFAENKIVSMQSGLKYQDLQVGTGAEAVNGKQVVVNYVGWLDSDKKGTKGNQFQSSYETGQPIPFVLGSSRVIKGWDEGIPGMRVGGKRILFVPSELGYGARSLDDIVPPNSALIFEVELKDVVEALVDNRTGVKQTITK